LNRVDETIMFRPLSRVDLQKIVGIQFKLIQKRLDENGIKIEADQKVLSHLGNIGFDPQFGARPLKRVMQREILNELSKDILSGEISKDSIIGITLSPENTVEFINLDEVALE
ncbi:MAG: ATP-dependent Clp protease ATP-binding subunit ClpB, partial [Gammaproteobacteria bacterium]